MHASHISLKILEIHETLQKSFRHLTRIAVALYEPETDTLQTFVNSTRGACGLEHYRAQLADVPSLAWLAGERQSRVVDDLSAPENTASPHGRYLLEAGFRSSLTIPIYARGAFLGFLFFDATKPGYFGGGICSQLTVYAQLIAALIQNEILPVRTLKGAVNTAQLFSRCRDEETAEHLARMAHFSRLIASGLPDHLGLDDEFVEFLFQFAPMHDIGKIAVPDHILMKQDALDPQEQAIMRGHVTKGVQIVDTMLQEFDLGEITHTAMLRNIVGCHHEAFDGSGYPKGLAGQGIPLEGRIVAVADAFDALASSRPYKRAWDPETALEYLQDQAERRYDPECVQALAAGFPQCMEIMGRFSDERRSPAP